MKIAIAVLLLLSAVSSQAATVTYDFNTGLSGSADSGITAGSIVFMHGTNSEANANQNAQRAWYSGDASGDYVYFVSARSTDNKGTAAINLDMTLGNPSYLSFSLAPAIGQNLDFSTASLSLDASLYRDNTTSFDMGYQVWADTGSGWAAVGSPQALNWVSGSGANTIYETDESTELTLGNGMTTGSVVEEPDSFIFDISSLGALATNQSVIFAVALSGTRDNHANFGSSINDVILSLNGGGGGATNDAPAAVDDAYSVVRGSELNVAEPGVLLNDTDPDGDAISAYLVSSVASGALTFNTNGSFDYVPAVGYTGAVNFTYALLDGTTTGNTAVATIQVLEPIAVERPNILIFFADDMGIGDTRVYNSSGSLPPSLPTIENFATNGMVFNDAHTQASLCAPSRYCILTGNYPWRGRLEGGSWHMNKGAQVMPGQRTIAHVLNDAGYHTSIFGKGHLGGYMVNTNGVADTRKIVWKGSDAAAYLAGSNELHSAYYDPRETDWTLPVSNGVSSALVGFDYSYMIYGGIQDPLYVYFENDMIEGNPNALELWNNPKFDTPNGVQWIYRPGYGLPGWYTCDVGPSLTQKTLDFIDAHVATNQVNGTDEPFFIHYCAEAVHVKHTPPTNFLGTAVAGTTGEGEHSDMLFELEVAFSNILAKLDGKGLLDDTLVIFTSDNGGLNESSLSGSHNPNEGLRGYKAGVWEGGHKVPMFIKWGDRIPAGSYDHMVGIHDLYATIAQLVGKNQGESQGLDAVSLLSILLSGNTAPVRDTMLHGRSGGQGDPAFIDDKARAYREGSYKLIWDRDAAAPVYLFDLASDPLESVDLLSDPGQVDRVARMTAKMTEYIALTGDADRHLDERSEPIPALRDLNENGMDDDWELAYFGSTNAVNGGPLDDWEPDGINNLLEFAFGSDPTVIDNPADVLPDFDIDGSMFEYVYRRRQDAASRNLHYINEQAENLISNQWSTAGLTEIGAEFIDADIESVTNQFSIAGTTNRFFRLQVEAQ